MGQSHIHNTSSSAVMGYKHKLHGPFSLGLCMPLQLLFVGSRTGSQQAMQRGGLFVLPWLSGSFRKEKGHLLQQLLQLSPS